MLKPTPSPKRQTKHALKGTALLFLAVLQSGCRNAAYSDLYVESMASEIRQLEDQLYDYDNEYHILEQELASLRAENQKLRQAPQAQNQRSLLSPSDSSGRNTDSLQFSPRDSGNAVVPEPLPQYTPPLNPSTETLPPKKADSILEAPGAVEGKRQLEQSLPELPKSPKTEPPKNAPPSDPLDIPNIDPGTPITILPGTPMPPGMPVLKDFSSNSSQPNARQKIAPANNLELNLSRIEVPNQLASTNNDRAQLKFGAEKPADMRIVEIAFHPSLSRAANFDDQSDDDGLYLVLQPKNVEGQLVPTFASLEVAVHDPARIGQDGPNESSRIGRWAYSANEVKSKFQPIGSNQGIHLTLPWNGPDPQADRVIVYVRYTMPDGRQVLNDKVIFVAGKATMKTVWVPRSDSSAVVTASGQQPAGAKATNVIPTQGSIHEPAPVPR